MKATVIVDNIGNEVLGGEWGLCILVEQNGKKIMVDTGASELFADNLKALGFDIRDIDYATLSHAHCDHSNGMARFFKDNDHAKFYLRNETDENCYKRVFLFQAYIGIPRNILKKYPERFEFVEGDHKLCDGAYLIPHKTAGLDKIGVKEKMYLKKGKRYVPDDFGHEQSLVLDTNQGLVIINSCSHGGAANIIREVQETFPGKKVHGLIGGLHLFKRTEEEIVELARAIKASGIEYVWTGHCTKNRAYEILHRELGDMVQQLHVGLEIQV